MNWGKGIIVSFMLFAAFIGVLVWVCVRQDISLVSRNYYQEELVYQHQIDRLNNTDQLLEKPRMSIQGKALAVEFTHFRDVANGELKLFRPSDIRFDKLFILHDSDEDTQYFDVGSLPKGMYKARMKWSMRGKEYFVEEIINI